jgi:hypothetical protein
LHADASVAVRSAAPRSDVAVRVLPRILGVPTSRNVDVTATELVDFILCPRRFQLAHVMRLVEHAPPREARVLEGQSAYARRVRREALAIRFGRRFLARASASGGTTVSVEGSVDLWIDWPDERGDALFFDDDPSLADPRADLTAALAAYAHSARAEVRTGTVRGSKRGHDEPLWSGPVDVREMNERLLAWGASLVAARWVETSPRAALPTCQGIRCGYVALCHPEEFAGSGEDGKTL